MSQASKVIADGSGAAVLAAINAALAAASSNNSGTGFPDYLVAGEFVWRTDVPGSGTWTLYAWDGANAASILTLDTASHEITLTDSVFAAAFGSTKGMLLKHNGTKWTGLVVGSAWQGLRVNGAGDDIEFGDQWQKIAADGSPASVASYSVSGIPAAINDVKIYIDRLVPATNNVDLRITLLDSSGAEINSDPIGYITTIGGYGSNSGATAFNFSAPYFGLAAAFIGTDSALPNESGVQAIIELLDIQSSRFKRGAMWINYRTTAGNNQYTGAGGFKMFNTSKITGYKIVFSTGNIDSGRIRTWGTR